jgi:uncharacterized membrane protein YfcA
MHRLRTYMAILAGSCIAGAAIVAALALGYYSWVALAVSVVIGAALSWPTGIWLARRIKRDDPAWDESRDRPKRT